MMRRTGLIVLSTPFLLSCVALGVPKTDTEVQILEPPDSAWVTSPVEVVVGALGGRGGWTLEFPPFMKTYPITPDTFYPIPAVLSVDGSLTVHLPETAFVHHIALDLPPGWHLLEIRHDEKTRKHRIRVTPADAFPVRYHPVSSPPVFPRQVPVAKHRDTLLSKDGWVLHLDFVEADHRWMVTAGEDTLRFPRGGLFLTEFPAGYLLNYPWDTFRDTVYWICASGIYPFSPPGGLPADFLMTDPLRFTTGICGGQAILSFPSVDQRWFAILSDQGVRETTFTVPSSVRILPECRRGTLTFRKVVSPRRSTLMFEKSLLIPVNEESLLVTPSRLYAVTPQGWLALELPELPEIALKPCSSPRKFFPPFFFVPFCTYTSPDVHFYPGQPYFQVQQRFYRFELHAGGLP